MSPRQIPNRGPHRGAGRAGPDESPGLTAPGRGRGALRATALLRTAWSALCSAVLIGAFVASPANAQPTTLELDHLGLAEGLLDEMVTALAQDQQGFIWIGTQQGLHRYDGYDIEPVPAVHREGDPRPWMGRRERAPAVPTAGPGAPATSGEIQDSAGSTTAPPPAPDSPSLQSQRPAEALRGAHITALAAATDGGLWIGTANHGLCHRQRDGTLRCGLAAGLINDLLEHRRTLWIATADRGLEALDLRDQSLRTWRHDAADPTSVPAGPLTDVAVDDDGTLWLASFGGGLAQRQEDGTFYTWRHDPSDPTTLPDDLVQALLIDDQGSLWVGTVRGGAARHLGDGRFQTLHGGSIPPGVPAPSNGRPSAATTSNDELAAGAPLSIQALAQDLDGALWIATFGNGLHRLDPRWRARLGDQPGPRPVQLDVYRASARAPLDPTSLPSDYLLHLLRDRSGLLWTGTDAGLSSFGGPRQRFPHYVNDLTQTNSLSHNTVWAFSGGGDDLWIGTSGGLNHLDGRTGVFRSWDPPLGPQVVLSLHPSAEGGLWIGTLNRGLLHFDPTSGRFESRLGAPGGPRGPEERPVGRRVEVIRADPDPASGALWLGLQDGGLVRFEPATGRFRQYLHRPGDSTSLAVNTLTDLAFDTRGRLWVATPAGLHRLEDPTSGRFRRFGSDGENAGLANERALDLFVTPGGQLWVGTAQGLERYDARRDSFDAAAPDLGPTAVYCSVDDASGTLWLATGRGLARLNPKAMLAQPPQDSELRIFDSAEELRSNRLDTGACHRGDDGRLYVGGIFGFHAFSPQAVQPNPHQPQVVLTRLQVMGADRPVEEIADGAGLVLQPQEHSVTFTVAALDFVRPEAHRFAYRLVGYDRDWVETNQRTARFASLPPGRYVFEARGTNSDGVESADHLSIPLRVLPPLWRSPWAYALYALAAVVLLASVLTGQAARVRRKSEEQRRHEDLERARTLQLSMLPTAMPESSTWEIAVHMTTAAEVGGDYYDFFTADDELWTAVGDATGHGISAGMMVSMTKIALRSLPSGSPEKILDQLGDVLRELHPSGLRMALALGQLGDDGSVRLAFAAMPPALIYRAIDGSVEEILRPALPLGGRLPSRHSSAAVKLAANDLLVLFSDGLPERRDGQDDPLGYPSVQECLQRHGAGASASRVLSALVQLGEDWARGRAAQDDVTLVVIRRRNPE